MDADGAHAIAWFRLEQRITLQSHENGGRFDANNFWSMDVSFYDLNR
jgi:hypothetical protein